MDKVESFWKRINDGLRVEIKNNLSSEKKIWTYYLHISKEKYSKYWHLIKDLIKQYKGFEGINFSGGITWKSIEKIQLPKLDREVGHLVIEEYVFLKVGCDYNHIWNKSEYEIEEILEDAMKTAEQFTDKYPI
jgi:hypothetical protein